MNNLGKYELNKIYNIEAIEGMEKIPNKSIDMILCDLPYGSTKNWWDTVIPLEELWKEYERIIKDNGAIVLTAQPPFDKVLAVSNMKLFRYEWIWAKTHATGFLNANKMPLKAHENILVFYKKLPEFHPQKTGGHDPVHYFKKHTSDGTNYGETKKGVEGGGSTERFPLDIIVFSKDTPKIHPTQKPIALFEYLISSYTNPGDIIMDNCMGSGTTAVAARNLGRRWIGFEIDKGYIEIANKRLEDSASIIPKISEPVFKTHQEPQESEKPLERENIPLYKANILRNMANSKAYEQRERLVAIKNVKVIIQVGSKSINAFDLLKGERVTLIEDKGIKLVVKREGLIFEVPKNSVLPVVKNPKKKKQYK